MKFLAKHNSSRPKISLQRAVPYFSTVCKTPENTNLVGGVDVLEVDMYCIFFWAISTRVLVPGHFSGNSGKLCIIPGKTFIA